MSGNVVHLTAFVAPGNRVFLANGQVAVNSNIYCYTAGTLTPCNTYSDYTGTVLNPNPIPTSAYGYPSTAGATVQIWCLAGTNTKFVLTDSTNTAYSGGTFDNVPNINDVNLSSLIVTGGNTGGINITAPPYNADVTGTTDATANIQHAMNDASNANTYIYAPVGTYKISSSLTNSTAPNWSGVRGDGASGTFFSGTGLSANAFIISNANVGFTMQDFTVIGPGHSASPVISGISFVALGSGITDHIYMKDVWVKSFSGNSFYFQCPIVSTFVGLRAQSGGQNGFYVDTNPIPDGGTSTAFVSCYANGIDGANSGAGYYIANAFYTSLYSCAADSCANSYYALGCQGFSMVSCGAEANGVTPNSNGCAIVLQGCIGATISSCWASNFPATNSVPYVILGGSYVALDSCSYTNGGGTEPNVHVQVSGTEHVIRCARSTTPNGTANIVDTGTNTFVMFGNQFDNRIYLNTSVSGNQDPFILFQNTNPSHAGNQISYGIFRNSQLGPNGSIAIGNTSAGALNLVVQDRSLAGQASYVQVNDPLNAGNGRIAFGDSGAQIDYNTSTTGAFVVSAPLTIVSQTSITGSLGSATGTVLGHLIGALTNAGLIANNTTT